MKAVIQRVRSARVRVDGEIVSEIGPGLLTLLGVAKGDEKEKVTRTIQKIVDLRVFEDSEGKMNRSIRDIQGDHLIVSQFTLVGDCTRGTRPSFSKAETPELAKPLYEFAIHESERHGVKTKGGVFRAHMQIELVNDGPVTLSLEV